MYEPDWLIDVSVISGYDGNLCQSLHDQMVHAVLPGQGQSFPIHRHTQTGRQAATDRQTQSDREAGRHRLSNRHRQTQSQRDIDRHTQKDRRRQIDTDRGRQPCRDTDTF